jgi:tetratricopeptide (TPR) repeat protein
MKSCNEVLQLEPTNYSALCNLGRVYKHQNLMDRAVETYTKALKIDSHGIDPLICLGEISLQLDRFDEARIFFESVLSLQPGLVKALLYLCEIDLKQNRILDFVGRCDLLLKELELNRDKTINDIEDIVAILLEIAFTTRNSPEIVAQVLKLLSLLPVDFASFLGTRTGALLENKDAEETEFFLKELQKLSEAPLEIAT